MAKIIGDAYFVGATSVGGRGGKVWSDDHVINLEMRSPGAPGSEGFANPEMLFAAGWAACFNGALKYAANLKRVRVGETEVKVTVSLGKDADGNFQLGAAIDVKIPGVDRNTAEELAKDAHGICPYSRATRGNVEVIVQAEGV